MVQLSQSHTRRREDAPGIPGGRYRPLRVAGVGGMGRVYECRDERLDRPVAVKVASRDGERDFDALLWRETRLTSRLEHPNIIPVYDGGENDGRHYQVMRYVAEPTLAHVIERLRAGDAEAIREHTLGRLLRHFIQVCYAVDYAHDRGVIHCDLKPANILLGSFGQVLVVDWAMAYDVHEGRVLPGGTPGFMAPEQLDPHASAYDGRTDVFALGAVLYQMVTLEDPIVGLSIESVLYEMQSVMVGLAQIEPPRKRVPHLDVPQALDDICMRALAPRPEDRFASARALATAVEEFLEGTKELERRRREADEHAARGDELAPRYHELLESRPQRLAALCELRQRVRPWDPPDAKQPLWDAEELIAVTDAVRVRTLHAAISAYEQALELAPSHARARAALTQLYGAELGQARERGDALAQIHFEELLKQHDHEGTTLAAICGDGRLRVCCDDPDLHVVLDRVIERGRRLLAVGEPRRLLALSDMTLPHGPWLLTVQLGDAEARFPLLIEPSTTVELLVRGAELRALGPDEVLVAGGPALLGGDPLVPESGDRRRVQVGSFAIQRFPVTFAAYLAFVAERLAAGDAGARDLLPLGADGTPHWRWEGGRWAPAPHLDAAAALRLPVFGIDVVAAKRYAEWLTKRTGRRHRLPRDDEWEKAARGCDGRALPWGQHFDAAFCKMRDSRQEPPTPEPVGSFVYDESPYGVRDMAGTIAEWVESDATDPLLRFGARGGAWCDSQIECRPAGRRNHHPRDRSNRVGFRLVREIE